ncbi:hypothetical protein, partial [Pseudomonas syringae group genomosp. 7]|uniref:hypothetical protein n=1 Tax=Pseudomonas syringae group genomosp. 7 TaxID=251699 RepID=UPI0037704973
LKARGLTVNAKAADAESAVPVTDGVVALFAALTTLFPGFPVRRDADFFTDLGRHSIIAARLATARRANPRFAQITVSDIY